MDGAALYEEDIYAWSQRQATVLRRMAALDPAALPSDLAAQLRSAMAAGRGVPSGLYQARVACGLPCSAASSQ